MGKIRGFAPATIANVGPGFDVIGLAIDKPGDEVEAEFTSEFIGVRLTEIINNQGLPLGPTNVVQAVGQQLYDSIRPYGKDGIKVTLYKNMNIGTGMGSSASSEAAVAKALLGLLDYPENFSSNPLKESLVYGEKIATGSPHPDNVLPSYYGGALVIHDEHNLDYIRFECKDSIYFVVCAPELRLDTRDMRKALPDMNKLVNLTRQLLKERANIRNHSYDLSDLNLDGIVDGISEDTADRYLKGSLQVMYGLRDNDAKLLGAGILKDGIVTPIRGRFIKGFDDVIHAAHQENAYGSSISGSGPSLFTVAPSSKAGYKIGDAMVKAWEKHGVNASIYVSPVNSQGAKLI